MRNVVLPVALLALTSLAASAANITPTVTSSAGTQFNTTALTTDATESADMVGSQVTITFADHTSEIGIWTAAGASGTGWSLTESGNTFTGTWSLTNSNAASAITGFTFDGVPGNTTFDIDDTTIASPGSGNGRPFSAVTGPAGLTVGAAYTNELLVGGTFYGDEYTKLTVTIGNGALGKGDVLNFESDTDNADATAGGITAATPEPSSFVFLATGLVGIGATVRRRLTAV